MSPIRSIANVVQTGTAGYRKLVTSRGAPSGWASETGARGEAGTPSFHEIVPPSGELFANPAASQALLDGETVDAIWRATGGARGGTYGENSVSGGVGKKK